MGKRAVVKIIDYNFQHETQLTQAFDDSNSLRNLDSNKLSCYVIGRYGGHLSIHQIEDNYKVIFLPEHLNIGSVANYILEELKPDVIHMHGSHGWPSYPFYANKFKDKVDKLIFSPAGSSCGTPEFLSFFDHIIVNHPLQVDRMKTLDKDKIIVRRRAVNTNFFCPKYSEILYSFVYVAGFVPVKQIPTMIETVISSLNSNRSLVIVGDFTRTASHYKDVLDFIRNNNLQDRIFLRDFMSQKELVDFLGNCGIFVWPDIKPENPSTTTNRSVVEAIGCGMPLLLGGRAFKDTDFVDPGLNGFLYSSNEEFGVRADLIFNNISVFRKESVLLSKERFNYEKNFVNFYNQLYGF